jgi:hypothetical protein
LIKHIAYDQTLHGLWVATAEELNFYEESTNQFYSSAYNPNNWKVFREAEAYVLTVDPEHKLWFRKRSNFELCSFISDRNEIYESGKFIPGGINQIQADPEGRIWILYWLDEAEIIDPADGKILHHFMLIKDLTRDFRR